VILVTVSGTRSGGSLSPRLSVMRVPLVIYQVSAASRHGEERGDRSWSSVVDSGSPRVVGCDNFVPHGSPVVEARVRDSADGEAVTGGKRP
jgi:hypothetical protein